MPPKNGNSRTDGAPAPRKTQTPAQQPADNQISAIVTRWCRAIRVGHSTPVRAARILGPRRRRKRYERNGASGRMALNFSLIDTTMDPLWDFGWFDLSRFKVDGPAGERCDGRHVLAAFLRDSISQRSFCDRTQWGENVQRHGPLRRDLLAPEFFRPIASDELEHWVQAALHDPQFTVLPSKEQRKPVEEWAAAIKARGDSTFVLDVPDQAEARVTWSFVWALYREFAAVSPDGKELAIAVIGYD